MSYIYICVIINDTSTNFNLLLFGGNLSRLCHIISKLDERLDCSGFWSQQEIRRQHRGAPLFWCCTYFPGSEGDVVFVFSCCQGFPVSRAVLTGILCLFRNSFLLRWWRSFWRLRGKEVPVLPTHHIHKPGMHPASSDALLWCLLGGIVPNLFRTCFCQSWFLKSKIAQATFLKGKRPLSSLGTKTWTALCDSQDSHLVALVIPSSSKGGMNRHLRLCSSCLWKSCAVPDIQNLCARVCQHLATGTYLLHCPGQLKDTSSHAGTISTCP